MIDKIDLVYLWVDGSDPNWAKKKATELAKLKGTSLNPDIIASCRFLQNDELKYSLRSVEKYANWINHIYIVTDNQIPKWLNLNNPNISIIDQSSLMPPASLPTFNSCAIETCLCNIPNLTNLFLYANDDMLFWNDTSPDFFFNSKKQAICRFENKIKNKEYKHPYGHQISTAFNLIKQKFNLLTGYFPHHGIDAYIKSSLIECNSVFKEQIFATTNHKFRDFNDVQRVIYSYYMIIQNKAIPLINKPNIFKKLFGVNENGYIKCKKHELKKALKFKYPILCINDGRSTTQDDRKFMKHILNLKFPNKSQFEI